MHVCMRMMEFLKELSIAKNPSSYSIEISLLVVLEHWREMEHLEGLHGREKGFIYLGCVG
jgi:hypothetical protein